MAFNIKTWFNRGNTTKTPLNADALNDLEKRIKNGFDSIIETGVNNNIYYAKHVNGLLECWGTVTIGEISATKRNFTRTLNLPQAYKDTNFSVIVSNNVKGGWWSDAMVGGRANSVSSIYLAGYYNIDSGQTAEDYGLYFKTIGFWK